MTLQLFLQQDIFQHVPTLHTDTTNSVLHYELCIHGFPEKPDEELKSLTHWMPAKV
jgi:hypothetical protein